MLVKNLSIALFLLLLSTPVLAGVVEDSTETIKTAVPDGPDTNSVISTPSSPSSHSGPANNNSSQFNSTPASSTSSSSSPPIKKTAPATKSAPKSSPEAETIENMNIPTNPKDDKFSMGAILLIIVLIGVATIYSRVSNNSAQDEFS